MSNDKRDEGRGTGANRSVPEGSEARPGFEGIQEASVVRDKIVASRDEEAKRALRDALNAALRDTNT